MTHRRVFALSILAMVLVAASACGGHPSGRTSLGTAPHRAGDAPIAPGGGAPATSGPTVPPRPAATLGGGDLTPVPIFEDFTIRLSKTTEAPGPTCFWTGGAGGTVTINLRLTPAHQGGIPGHEPTSVNFHLADLTGHQSPEYTSGFTTGVFAITEPIANFDRTMAFNAVVDLSAPDSKPQNDNLRIVVDVFAGKPADWTYLYGPSGALTCHEIISA